MCGLTGCLAGNADLQQMQHEIQAMTRRLRHRGPDDEGIWVDAQAGIGLGHRRLSIIDTSPLGHQPMISASGRYVIALNGEIYNYKDLRAELASHVGALGGWRGHSDTEVLLAGIECWGFERALGRIVGMFAIALWDREERTLHLARDRLGEKPLYYGWQGESFFFGSELKALRAHSVFRASIDRNALSLYLRFGYVPTPHSIYAGIFKLPAGSRLEVRLGQCSAKVSTYWSTHALIDEGQRSSYAGSDEDAVVRLDALLRQALAGQMVADVPLGAFLSGGIDSSTVVALMQRMSSRPVKTFSIGFAEQGFDEASHARAVAQHLGTDHTELYVDPEHARSVIPGLPTLYDEPFADSSQIPTFLLSELARTQVAVALSGDGADELFGGYNRYFWANRIWRNCGSIPRSLRTTAGALLTRLSHTQWDRLFATCLPFIPAKYRYPHAGYKLHRLAEALRSRSPEEFYLRLVSQWTHSGTELVLEAEERESAAFSIFNGAIPLDFRHRMMFADMVSYLPDDILVKLDRAAMGVSLETRVPYLDHRIVEFAWQLPLSLKIRNTEGKWIVREVLGKYVPKELTTRPKTGFAVPIGDWLRGPLREWAEDLLDESAMRRAGFLNPVPVQRKWSEHLSGKRDWRYHLWNVLMFQAWHEQA